MIDGSGILGGIWSFVKGRPTTVVRGQAIPTEQVQPKQDAETRFEAGKHYFAVIINEMFLASSRQWFSIYDPMALVVTEFTYSGKRVTVPYVVGPAMLEKNIAKVPNGMSITDTKVAGVSPYVGGSFALTIVLAQVRRASYAKRLLDFVETVANVFPSSVALHAHLKVANTVLDGVQTLLGIADDVQPIAGHRWEYNPGMTPGLKPGFLALIDADLSQLDSRPLSVVDGRLFDGNLGSGSRYREADFLLYSLLRVDERTDDSELPFYSIFELAKIQAGSTEDGAWDRAKAGIQTAYQEMLRSPDLTLPQITSLITRYKSELQAIRRSAEEFRVMGGDGTQHDISLFVPEGLGEQFDAKGRAEALRKANQLLAM